MTHKNLYFFLWKLNLGVGRFNNGAFESYAQNKQKWNKQGPSPTSASSSFTLFKQLPTIKTVYFSGIQTQIIGMEGERADHLATTTTAVNEKLFTHFEWTFENENIYIYQQELYLSNFWHLPLPCSVTRLGDFVDFGQILKPVATISLPNSTTFLGNFCKGVKIFSFSNNHLWATL